jgi:hypothetical protein
VGQRLYPGMPWLRHFAAAGMALLVSGSLRLAEFFIQHGTLGVK